MSLPLLIPFFAASSPQPMAVSTASSKTTVRIIFILTYLFKVKAKKAGHAHVAGSQSLLLS
jgi:hypothetical protein